MKMLLEMRLQLQLGKRQEYLLKGSHFCQRNIIGGVQDLLDHVDQILKFFIGFETVNFHQKDLM
jgi:hypothetical protein